MPFFLFEDKKIYYETFGSGIPVVFIHEWNLSSSLFVNTYKKYAVDKFKFVVFDLPGFGKSEGISSISFEAFSKIIDKLLLELRIEEAYFLGSCLGAVISLDYAIRREEKIKGLILVEVMMYFPLPLFVLFLPFLGKILMKFFSKTSSGLKTFTFFMWGRNKKLKRLFEFFIKSAKENISYQYLWLLYNYSKMNHYRRAKNLNIPVIFINGEKTINPVKKSTSRLYKNINFAKKFILKSSKHFPLYENPSKIIKIMEEGLHTFV